MSSGRVPQLPYEKLMECTHCGLCLPYCPTYRELGVEMDSPRGRIYLVRALVDGRTEVTERLSRHLDLCVGCRACETACPSGVSFASILEHGRNLLGPRPGIGATLDNLLYTWVLPRKSRIAALGHLLSLVQRSPLRRLLALALNSPLVSEKTRHTAELLTFLPADPLEGLQPVNPGEGRPRATVGFLVCCMMRVLMSEVNHSTVRVLNRNGCHVFAPPSQECCGALHAHAGRLEAARALAMTNIEAFEGQDLDAIVTVSAGCGAHMKEYAELFTEEDGWRERAMAFSRKVRDISEFLHGIGLSASFGPLSSRVAYDDPCHLLHGQGIRSEPRELLKEIPGLELVDLKEADWCCGSAGTYMLAEREMALRLLSRKIEDIRHSGADIVATGNPGCLLWIEWGLRREGVKATCVHPVQLLDAASGGPDLSLPSQG